MCQLARLATGCATTLGATLRLLACLLLAVALPASAATYTATSTAATATAYPWIDISGSGTGLSLGDDGLSATITLPFAFTLGSSSAVDLVISSNGMVQFGGSSTAHANTALPLDGSSGRPTNINKALLPLWDDLNPGTNQIRYATTGSAPNRVFVVSYLAVPFYGSSNTATFQVQLHEQGAIVYRYQTVVGGGVSATIGLEVDDTDYTLFSLNTASVSSGTTILWSQPIPVAPGLTGSYFSNQTLTAPTALVRVDSTVNFNWGTAAPATGMPIDNFSVRWTGYLRVPTTGSYRFQTNSDDGVRLWVNGAQVINNWTLHGPTLDTSAPVTLNAGVDYPITMEFFEAGGGAVAVLNWMKPGDTVYTVIPGGTAAGGGLFTDRSTGPFNLVALYDFNEASYTGTTGELKDTAGYPGGPYNGKGQGSAMPGVASTSPARIDSPGSCKYATLAGPISNGPGFISPTLPVDTTTTGAQVTVAFWMYWNGAANTMPIGFGTYDLFFSATAFGFNTSNADVYGISTTGLANTWRHVVAVFTTGDVTRNQLWIDGVQQTLSQRAGTPLANKAWISNTLRFSGWGNNTNYRFIGRLDQVRIYNGPVTAAEAAALYAETPSDCPPALHSLAIEHASGTGLTCTPSTLTVKACRDAGCTTPYTYGVTGSLSATGGSVVWPDGASFSIPAGSSSTTLRMHATSTTAALVAGTASSPTATNATTCNFGSPSCTFTAADSGFLFDVPHHVSEVAQTVNVSAVRKSDNSTVCTPAFASTSKTVTFTCGYTSPTTGTLPVRVGGTALNAGGSTAAACDTGGRGVSLSFNASGVASTTVQYADAGQMLLSARYAGATGGSEAGLVMTGSDSFIAAPDHFTISGVTAAPIRAGSTFSATVTARNSAGATTLNHGRETAAQRAAIGWVKRQPNGAGAVPGSFSGTALRSFTNGAVSVSDLSWTEVGRGDLVVRGSDAAGYLGSGLHVFGSSVASGARTCGAENGSCVLPGGTTATVYYGAPGGWTAKGAQTGTVACTNANFSDPISGTPKRCYYIADATASGSVGDFIPHRFSVAAPNACSAFTYAGQPATATVTALNTAGSTTLNFNGTATTTPTFAQAVTLSDANSLGLGTLSGTSIAVGGFNAGVATSQVSYAFTAKTTAPQNLVLRASNGLSGTSLVSSAGGTEATLALRSGRMRLANAFGSAAAALQVPVVTEYWGGNAWVLNSADSCTALAGTSVAMSNPRGATGSASTATTSAGALAISSGSGLITLAAPSPTGSSLSLDLAVNLGSTTTDQSCQAAHPTTTGAGLPWLRAVNGACATTADRDPAARASFGIFSPETRRTVHVRELF